MPTLTEEQLEQIKNSSNYFCLNITSNKIYWYKENSTYYWYKENSKGELKEFSIIPSDSSYGIFMGYFIYTSNGTFECIINNTGGPIANFETKIPANKIILQGFKKDSSLIASDFSSTRYFTVDGKKFYWAFKNNKYYLAQEITTYFSIFNIPTPEEEDVEFVGFFQKENAKGTRMVDGYMNVIQELPTELQGKTLYSGFGIKDIPDLDFEIEGLPGIMAVRVGPYLKDDGYTEQNDYYKIAPLPKFKNLTIDETLSIGDASLQFVDDALVLFFPEKFD